jgi:hypothetical protein
VTKTVVFVQARNINKSHGETKSEDDDYIFCNNQIAPMGMKQKQESALQLSQKSGSISQTRKIRFHL